MSDRGTKLTDKGLQLLVECQTGKRLTFTRVAMGDGEMKDGENIRALETLKHECITLPIKSCDVTGKGTTTLVTQLINNDLEKGFFAREVGIFAKGEDGKEVLYAIRNTGNDSEYIPAGGGSECIDMIYEIVTVVDQCENVTAVINGEISYVSRVDFNQHKESVNPHPALLKIGEEVKNFDVLNCDFKKAGDKTNYISLSNVRRQILGDETSTIPVLQSRLEQQEREMSNVLLKMEAENTLPDCNLYLAESFHDCDSIDRLNVKVKSCAAGDNSIDIESDTGIIVGSWYWISDGVHAEYLQVKSIIKNSGIYRIIAYDKLKETYRISTTYIYRTTARIDTDMGTVYGSGEIKGFNWKSSMTWRGTGANMPFVVDMETSVGKKDNFDISGNIILDKSNMIALEG